ncbi:MAG: c-type cytochrome [Thermoleophilaceae bacterium]|nr:c-type cytochrome [Thermoleophilaceae bacterium]
MFNRTRILLVLALVAVAAFASGCGSQGVSLADNTSAGAGAQAFAEKCGGCHTISYAGTTGSKPDGEVNSKDRTNGPNFDQRKETYQSAITAIRQGGFSGAIMPGNIVTGQEAEDVATFLAKYSGRNPN